jgi:hypothetical protein
MVSEKILLEYGASFQKAHDSFAWSSSVVNLVITNSPELVEVAITLITTEPKRSVAVVVGQKTLAELLAEPYIGEEEVRWLMTRHGLQLFDSDAPKTFLYKRSRDKYFTPTQARRDCENMIGAALSAALSRYAPTLRESMRLRSWYRGV